MLFCFMIGLIPVNETSLGLDLIAQKHIFADGQQRNQGQFLMDNNNTLCFAVLQCFELAQLSVIINLTCIGIRRINTRQDIHQCGFASTVLADQCVNFSAFNNQIDIIQCLDARKFLCNGFHFQNDICQNKCPPSRISVSAFRASRQDIVLSAASSEVNDNNKRFLTVLQTDTRRLPWCTDPCRPDPASCPW